MSLGKEDILSQLDKVLNEVDRDNQTMLYNFYTKSPEKQDKVQTKKQNKQLVLQFVEENGFENASKFFDIRIRNLKYMKKNYQIESPHKRQKSNYKNYIIKLAKKGSKINCKDQLIFLIKKNAQKYDYYDYCKKLKFSDYWFYTIKKKFGIFFNNRKDQMKEIKLCDSISLTC